jgi:Serpin (serine protease inhibitor)
MVNTYCGHLFSLQMKHSKHILLLAAFNLVLLDLSVEPAGPQYVPADTLQVAAANNEFAMDLGLVLSKRKGDFVGSLFAVHTCLTMTSVGVQGNTATEMLKVLHLSTMVRRHSNPL